jgi:hypothetical protein
VPDDRKGTTPRRAQGGARRRPRFSLPPDHHEELENERTTERIEAFLDGPAKPRRPRRRTTRPEGVQRPRAVVPLDTRTDWERAVRHEDARVARYGRHASVLIVDVVVTPAGGEDRFAGRLGTAIRAQARETDRVARVGPARFHLLLPETDEAEAASLAERICRACREVLPVPPGPTATIRTASGSARDGETLADALRAAGARLDA